MADQPPCVNLAWDSEFFGLNIGRVLSDRLDQESAVQIDSWAQENRIDCLYFLARSDDMTTVRIAEQAGFRLADIRMTLSRDMVRLGHNSEGNLAPDVLIRDMTEADLARLRVIASENHQDSRFFFDGRFPRERSSQLYAIWVENSYHGYADRVLIADWCEQPVGYITCHFDKGTAKGVIGLLGVGKDLRGRGFGQALVQASLSWFDKIGAKKVEVVTQARNIAAQRLYYRLGFLPDSVELWYHKWYRGGMADSK